MTAASNRTHRRLLLAAIVAATFLLAWIPSARAVDFTWDGVAAGGVNPGYIATDKAGRLYVPVRGQGKVLVYDKAINNNRLLATLGAGRLTDPEAVAVDVRDNIYIADNATNTILTYGPYSAGANYQGVYGTGGGGLGQFSGLKQLATDREPRVYAAEAGNARVQALDPAAGKFNNLFAFGISDPGGWGPIAGVANEPTTPRFYVSSSSPADPIRVYTPSGALAGNFATTGSAAGQVKAPRGLDIDTASRLLVADTGNDRIQLFNSAVAGWGWLGEFGSSGSGDGKFNGPESVVQAPGAVLYVADVGNSRIVRLRYDDVDGDAAIDALDNCKGLSNPGQTDVDGDGIGDDCDPDIDGDGFANAADKCPQVKPYTDKDNDGCQDPFSKVTSVKAKKSVAPSRFSLRGTASAGTLGVAGVRVALARSTGSGCSWYSSKLGRFVKGSCSKPVYLNAKGSSKWRLSVKKSALRAGAYRVVSRAQQKSSGVLEARGKRSISFRISP